MARAYSHIIHTFCYRQFFTKPQGVARGVMGVHQTRDTTQWVEKIAMAPRVAAKIGNYCVERFARSAATRCTFLLVFGNFMLATKG